MRSWAVFVALVAVGCGGEKPSIKQRGQAGDIAIVNVTVLPMDRERSLPDQTVVVRGDRIAVVGPSAEIAPGDARVIDGRGKWLMPALADMHVHLWGESDLPLFLLNGVTTVRNMFGSPEHVTWRNRIARGELDGPTLLTAGPIIDGDPPTWPGSAVATTPEQARAIVREHKQAGYDLLKIYNGLALAVYEAILDEARAQGMPVDGHVPRAVGIDKAISSGQRSIEHLEGYLPFRGQANVGKAIVAATAHSTVWNCPTLVVTERFARMDHPESLGQTRGLEHVGPMVRAAWDPKNDLRLSRWTPQMYDGLRTKNVLRKTLIRDLARAGARLVLGTDTGNPYVVAGFAVHDELAFLVGAGLSPWQALRTATAAPAEMLGTPGAFGVVAPGARADLILVDRDPSRDVGAVTEPRLVIVRGAVRRRDELLRAVTAGQQRPPADRFASLEPIPVEGKPVVSARYEVVFRDQVVGVEQAVLSRLDDGQRIVRGQTRYGNTGTSYRSSPASLELTTGEIEGEVRVVFDGKKAVGQAGKGPRRELAAAQTAVIAPQTIAEFFHYAQLLADLPVGKKRVIDAVEVMTERGALRLDPARFELARVADRDGRRVYDLTGTHGTLAVTGTLVVDPDGAPHEATLVVSFGTQIMRRVD